VIARPSTSNLRLPRPRELHRLRHRLWKLSPSLLIRHISGCRESGFGAAIGYGSGATGVATVGTTAVGNLGGFANRLLLARFFRGAEAGFFWRLLCDLFFLVRLLFFFRLFCLFFLRLFGRGLIFPSARDLKTGQCLLQIRRSLVGHFGLP
jgi:hypothetical protein